MRAGFNVAFEDGTSREIIVAIPDFLAWARSTGKRAEEMSGAGLEDWLTCMWYAAQRTRLTEATFEDWTATIIDIDRIDKPAPKVTPKGRSKGS